MAGRAISLVLMATVALAGCSGGAGDQLQGLEATGTGIDAGDGTGSIRGLVVDEASLPVEGAQVGILALDLTATTGVAGDFSFTGMAAGTYQVFVQKLGFTSAAKSVDVADGAEAIVQFELAGIAVDEVYSEIVGPYSGFVTCAFTQPGIEDVRGSVTYNCNTGAFETIMGEQHNTLEFELSQNNIWAVIGEMKWTPAAYATSDKFALFFTYDDGYGPDWWCMANGNSPVQFVYHVDENKTICDGQGSGDGVEDPPDTDHTLHVTAFMGFQSMGPSDPTGAIPPNVAFQQRYESIVTLYYGLDPELPYSGFQDA